MRLIHQRKSNKFSKLYCGNRPSVYKGKEFPEQAQAQEKADDVLQILYTGNLYSGRYQTLLKLCRKLHECNRSGLKAQLHIYSGTDLSEKQIAELNLADSSFFKGSVSEEEVSVLQEKADVLLHIEPMSLKGSLLCRLSFSTKLVDYFHKRKTIFAVGSSRCASMKYLTRNDAAIVSISMHEAEEKLERLLCDKALCREYAEKAWSCGAKNHQIHQIQQKLRDDLTQIIG